MMKPEAFQQVVDAFKQRRPFQPFFIEFDDGRRLVVDQPGVLHSLWGSATHYPPGGEITFVESEDVRQVLELTPAPSTP